MVFHWFLKVFWSPGDAKIALCWTYVGARLGRRLGGVLERSWEVFGRPRRPQDAHKTPQDGHKTPQDATMTVQDGSKTRPRCSQDAPKTHSRRKLRQDVPVRPRNAKTLKKPRTNIVFFRFQKRAQDAQRRPQDAPRCPQTAPKTPQDAPKTPPGRPRRAHDAPKMFPRRAQDAFKTEAAARLCQ